MESIAKVKEFIKNNQDIYTKVTVEKTNNVHYARLNGTVYMPKVWQELVDELGRIPSQKEFTIRGILHARYWFKNPSKLEDGVRWVKLKDNQNQTYTHGFEWNQELAQSVAHRVWRSYPSMVAEYTTLLTMRELYPTATILTDDNLDYIIGSDITMILDNKVYYVHVLKDTHGSFEMMRRKGNYTTGWYDSYGRRQNFFRDFNQAHVAVAYDSESTHKTEEYNGLIFMHKEYIRNRIEKAEGEPFEESQLKDLHERMCESGRKGIAGVDEYMEEGDWSWIM